MNKLCKHGTIALTQVMKTSLAWVPRGAELANNGIFVAIDDGLSTSFCSRLSRRMHLNPMPCDFFPATNPNPIVALDMVQEPQ
jgi:hypothetical protein